MNTNPSKTVLVDLDDIDPFPLQATFYSKTTAGEDEALERVVRDGVYDPIVVLPANPKRGRKKLQFLDGHRRGDLLRKIGETKAKAILRHDLTDADDATIEAAFLSYNFSRRQLTMLEKGRIGLRLLEIEKNKPRRGIKAGSDDEGEARDRVGKLLGMSGRHLHRIFRVLMTPPEIQHAVELGLPLAVAERVEGMRCDKRDALAEKIRELTDLAQIKSVVAEYTGEHGRHHQRADGALSIFVRRLEAGLLDLRHRLDELSANNVASLVPALHRSRTLIDELWADVGVTDVDAAA